MDENETGPAQPAPALPHRYARTTFVVGPGKPGEFRRSLSGLAPGPHDAIYALGDDEVRVFEGAGRLARTWRVPEKATCLGVASDLRVGVGSPGRVDLYSDAGVPIGGFAAGARDTSLGRRDPACRFGRTSRQLLVSESLDRVQRGGPSGWPVSSDNPDPEGCADAGSDRPHGHDGREP